MCASVSSTGASLFLCSHVRPDLCGGHFWPLRQLYETESTDEHLHQERAHQLLLVLRGNGTWSTRTHWRKTLYKPLGITSGHTFNWLLFVLITGTFKWTEFFSTFNTSRIIKALLFHSLRKTVYLHDDKRDTGWVSPPRSDGSIYRHRCLNFFKKNL